VRRGGLIALITIALLCGYGVYNAHHLQTTTYAVTIKKQVTRFNHLKIALVSDLHLGYNYGLDEVNTLVNTINKGKPDLVVFAGDIFDNEYRAVEKPAQMIQAFKKISSKYGCYAVYGNHDIEEKIFCGFTFNNKTKPVSTPKMDAFLKQANIHLLCDQGVEIADSFYLFGRGDYMRPGRGITKRKSPAQITVSMDQNKPIIVIDHEPRQLSSLAKAGVDLDLSGHTHNGQLFPGNMIVSAMYENVYGYLRKENMHSIVTSGAGCFGPYMRVAAKSEICMINVNFQ
jgi:predicted MPP superfamily phosphohydrolase